jgi:hypothetical protein
MNEREQPAEPYETPEVEDVELVGGVGETASGTTVSVVRAI